MHKRFAINDKVVDLNTLKKGTIVSIEKTKASISWDDSAKTEFENNNKDRIYFQKYIVADTISDKVGALYSGAVELDVILDRMLQKQDVDCDFMTRTKYHTLANVESEFGASVAEIEKKVNSLPADFKNAIEVLWEGFHYDNETNTLYLSAMSDNAILFFKKELPGIAVEHSSKITCQTTTDEEKREIQCPVCLFFISRDATCMNPPEGYDEVLATKHFYFKPPKCPNFKPMTTKNGYLPNNIFVLADLRDDIDALVNTAVKNQEKIDDLEHDAIKYIREHHYESVARQIMEYVKNRFQALIPKAAKVNHLNSNEEDIIQKMIEEGGGKYISNSKDDEDKIMIWFNDGKDTRMLPYEGLTKDIVKKHIDDVRKQYEKFKPTSFLNRRVLLSKLIGSKGASILYKEISKYSSVEDFKKSLAESDTPYVSAIRMMLPVSVVAPKKDRPFETLQQDVYEPGRKIEDPIAVAYDVSQDKFILEDGANRVMQAIANKDITIIALVEITNSANKFKSLLDSDKDLTSIYNAATGKKASRISDKIHKCIINEMQLNHQKCTLAETYITSLWIAPDGKQFKWTTNITHVDWVKYNAEMLETKYNMPEYRFEGKDDEGVKQVLFANRWVRVEVMRGTEIGVQGWTLEDVKSLTEDMIYKYKPKEIFIDTEIEGSFYMTYDLFKAEGWDALERLRHNQLCKTINSSLNIRSYYNTATKKSSVSDSNQKCILTEMKQLYKNVKAYLNVRSYIKYTPGHKNSKGEDAPWTVRKHQTGKILSAYPTKEEAEKALQRMHMFKHKSKKWDLPNDKHYWDFQSEQWKPYDTSKPLYRTISGKAIDSLVDAGTLESKGPVTYFSKRPFIAPGWLIIKVKANSDAHEMVYEKGAAYSSEEEVITEMPTPISNILGLCMPYGKENAQKSHADQYSKIIEFANKNDIPVYYTAYGTFLTAAKQMLPQELWDWTNKQNVNTPKGFINQNDLKRLYEQYTTQGILDEELLDKIVIEIIVKLESFVNIVKKWTGQYYDFDEKGRSEYFRIWDKSGGRFDNTDEIFSFDDSANGVALYDHLKRAKAGRDRILALDAFIHMAHDRQDYGDEWVEGGRAFLDELAGIDAVTAASKEMEDWFEKRTNNHIKLVQKYCKKIYDYDKEKFDGLVERGEVHDASKLESPEKEPYVYISWSYKCKDDGVEYKPPADIKEKMNKATEHHVKHNRHHPEFHSDKEVELINREDRDKLPAEMIDATKMTDLDIAEMVADWLGMSEEKETNPKDWADKNVNIRWKFTPEQKDLIYKLIDEVWGTAKASQLTADRKIDIVQEKTEPTELAKDVPNDVYVGTKRDYYYGWEGWTGEPIKEYGLQTGVHANFPKASHPEFVYVAVHIDTARSYAHLYSNPIILKINTSALNKNKFYLDPDDFPLRGVPEQLAYKGDIPASAISVAEETKSWLLKADEEWQPEKYKYIVEFMNPSQELCDEFANFLFEAVGLSEDEVKLLAKGYYLIAVDSSDQLEEIEQQFFRKRELIEKRDFAIHVAPITLPSDKKDNSSALIEPCEKSNSWLSSSDLKEYKKKRDFSKTKEPEGEIKESSEMKWVLQRHEAEKAGLHGDLRLEEEGVLKSFVIRKLDEFIAGDKDKVLVINTEDHPIQYATFEGDIPKGEYGGGRISIDDKGHYKTLVKTDKKWEFELDGKKLKGKFALIKTELGKNKWFLIRMKNQKGV